MTFNVYPIIPGPLNPSDPIFVKLETLKCINFYVGSKFSWFVQTNP